MKQTGTLYVVALPIGNYLDISDRAKQVLEKVDVVAAEDTRNLRSLAQEICIELKQVLAHHNHNERESLHGILKLLKENKKTIALVSDAGTPVICDPGHRLIKKCLEEKIPVVPIPGASSLTASLSVNPIGGSDHLFLGFLPSKASERRKKLLSLEPTISVCSKLVFFESPHRIKECLGDIKELFGNPIIFMAREITKTYESFYFGNCEELLRDIPDSQWKGEYVVSIDSSSCSLSSKNKDFDLNHEIDTRLAQGLKPKEIQKELAEKTEIKGKALYQKIMERKV